MIRRWWHRPTGVPPERDCFHWWKFDRVRRKSGYIFVYYIIYSITGGVLLCTTDFGGGGPPFLRLLCSVRFVFLARKKIMFLFFCRECILIWSLVSGKIPTFLGGENAYRWFALACKYIRTRFFPTFHEISTQINCFFGLRMGTGYLTNSSSRRFSCSRN